MNVDDPGTREPSPELDSVVDADSVGSPGDLPPPGQFADLSHWGDRQPGDRDAGGTQSVPVGTTGDEASRPKRYGRLGLVALAVLALIASIVGLAERYDLTSITQSVPLGSQPSLTQVESRHGRTLFLETHGDTRRVLVQTHGQASWQLVSKDDVTAVNPSLSPSSERVAYLSEKNDGSIVIVSLLDSEEYHITSEDIEDFVRRMPSAGTKVCSWTPISWDPDGHRVAFFGCREEPPLSIVVIADVSSQSPALGIVTGSDMATLSHRQVHWSSTTELIISVIDGDAKLGHQIMTLTAPATVTSAPSTATPTSPAPTTPTQDAATPVGP